MIARLADARVPARGYTAGVMTKERAVNSYLINDTRGEYEERLREAEARRLVKLASTRQAGERRGLRVRLGEYLIALGGHLKGPARPAAQID